MSSRPGLFRRLLRARGLFVVVALAFTTSCLAYLTHEGRALDREGRAYAESSLQAITSHWDMNEAWARSTPRLRQAVSEERLASLFGWFSSLGPLMSYSGCVGQTMAYRGLSGQTTVMAEYRCPARYRDGDATVTLQLRKQLGSWRIDGFDVDSEILAKSPPSEPI